MLGKPNKIDALFPTPYVAPAGGDRVSPPDVFLDFPQPMPQNAGRMDQQRQYTLASQRTIPLLVMAAPKGPRVKAPTTSREEIINQGKNGISLIPQHLGQTFKY